MKQVICIRKDLRMRRGKEIAQGAHASGAFLLDALSKNCQLTTDQQKWVHTGMKKVCLQVNSEEELINCLRNARDAGLIVHVIRDNGLTEFNGVPTLTCLAIGPNEDAEIDAITGTLALY